MGLMTQKDMAQQGSERINAFLAKSKEDSIQKEFDEDAMQMSDRQAEYERKQALMFPDPTKEEEGLVDPVAMFTPFVSDVIDVGRAAVSAYQGDWGTALMSGVAAIPYAGESLKAGMKSLKKVDADTKEEWQKLNKVKQRQEQLPELKQSAQDKVEGKITTAQHQANVDAVLPVKLITEVPPVPTHKEMGFALTDNKVEAGLVGKTRSIKQGEQVSTRLDIPAYDNYDTWVVSVHFPDKGTKNAYAKTASLKNVTFAAPPRGGYKISQGTGKAPIAMMGGKWQDIDPKKVQEQAKSALNSDEWVQVGYNPFRHSYFYDKVAKKPVVSATELIQVGPLVLARGVKYADPDDARFLVADTGNTFNQGGLVDAEMETLNFSHGGDVHGKAQALDSDQRLKMFTDFVQSNTEGAKKEDTLVERFKGWVENAVRPDTTEQKPVAEEDTLVGRFKGWVEESVKAGQQRVDAKTMESEEIDVVQAPVVEAPVVEVQPEVEVEVETRTAADIQTDEILSKATPDIGFVDEVLLDFENSEGIYKHKSVEGGEDTGPYGLKDGMADLNMADFTTEGKVDYKAAATSLLKIRVGQLNKGYPKFNSMPSSLKKTLLSTVWNQGVSGANELRKGINKAMELPQEKQGAAVIAIMKTDLLDGIAAMDDKGTKDKSDDRKRPMVGLMARKAADYNLTAQHYGLPLIASWDLVDKKDDYKIGGVTFREKATYYDEQGNVLKVHYKESRKHRNSSRAGSFKTNKVKSASVDNTDWAGAIT
jgi:hypothetical protein